MIHRERTGKRRKGIRRAASALAAVMLVTALMAQTGLASDSIDPLVVSDDGSVQGGTITVLPSEGLELPEGTVFDVYQIAGAESVPKQDGYAFKDFKAGEAFYNNNIKDVEDPSAETLNEFAQALASAAQTGQITPVKTGLALGTKTDAAAGLYLIILHGEDKAYWDTADDKKTIVTTMKASNGTIAFAPIVVSLPNRTLPKQEDWDAETIEYLGGEITSGGAAGKTHDRSTPWVYDITIKAKAALGNDEIGKLKITKNLLNYEHMEGRNDQATFIFRIEAEGFSGEVESIVLGGGKLSDSVIAENLPIGKELTVTEITPLGDYEADGPTFFTVTIPSADPADMPEVIFRNKHNGGYKGGGSVKNTYGTTGTEGEEGTSWSWNSTPQQTKADDHN